jgi:hypothetical protein
MSDYLLFIKNNSLSLSDSSQDFADFTPDVLATKGLVVETINALEQ